MPRINDKPLRVTEYVELFRWVKTRSRHPVFNFVLTQKQLRTVSVRSLGIISVHLDEGDPPSGLYIGGKRLQISLPVFNVMEHIMKESQIHIPGRQLGITEFPFDGLDIL